MVKIVRQGPETSIQLGRKKFIRFKQGEIKDLEEKDADRILEHCSGFALFKEVESKKKRKED